LRLGPLLLPLLLLLLSLPLLLLLLPLLMLLLLPSLLLLPLVLPLLLLPLLLLLLVFADQAIRIPKGGGFAFCASARGHGLGGCRCFRASGEFRVYGRIQRINRPLSVGVRDGRASCGRLALSSAGLTWLLVCRKC
jgi:hypothetical protein